MVNILMADSDDVAKYVRHMLTVTYVTADGTYKEAMDKDMIQLDILAKPIQDATDGSLQDIYDLRGAWTTVAQQRIVEQAYAEPYSEMIEADPESVEVDIVGLCPQIIASEICWSASDSHDPKTSLAVMASIPLSF